MSIYEVGDLVTLQATFTSIDGVNTDPTTITLSVQDPGGTITTYTYAGAAVTKFATGIFRYTLSITLSGTYVYRWKGTGTVQAASPDCVIQASTTVF
jgi:hypothetical protein